MNKLNALIEWCKLHYTFSPDEWFSRDQDVEAIRRILEAVREDMAITRAGCINRRNIGDCYTEGYLACRTCPMQRHAKTREALDLK